MNNLENRGSEKRNSVFTGRTRDIFILVGLGLALLFASWKIFQKDTKSASQALSTTENELKIVRLLENIDGVGDVDVVICETEDEIKSVVVVCEGASDLRVTLNIREAVSAALGTEQNVVKIYLKKE